MRKMVVVRDKRKSDKYSMANREMENGGRKKRDMTKTKERRGMEKGEQMQFRMAVGLSNQGPASGGPINAELMIFG